MSAASSTASTAPIPPGVGQHPRLDAFDVHELGFFDPRHATDLVDEGLQPVRDGLDGAAGGTGQCREHEPGHGVDQRGLAERRCGDRHSPLGTNPQRRRGEQLGDVPGEDGVVSAGLAELQVEEPNGARLVEDEAPSPRLRCAIRARRIARTWAQQSVRTESVRAPSSRSVSAVPETASMARITSPPEARAMARTSGTRTSRDRA